MTFMLSDGRLKINNLRIMLKNVASVDENFTFKQQNLVTWNVENAMDIISSPLKLQPSYFRLRYIFLETKSSKVTIRCKYKFRLPSCLSNVLAHFLIPNSPQSKPLLFFLGPNLTSLPTAQKYYSNYTHPHFSKREHRFDTFSRNQGFTKIHIA